MWWHFMRSVLKAQEEERKKWGEQWTDVSATSLLPAVSLELQCAWYEKQFHPEGHNQSEGDTQGPGVGD